MVPPRSASRTVPAAASSALRAAAAALLAGTLLASLGTAVATGGMPEGTVALGTTSRLEILPLVEAAAAAPDLATEQGVSYLVRTDTQTILLDLGYNASGAAPTTLVHNLGLLGLGLDDVDAVVISHPHPDHVGGIQPWRQHTLAFGGDPVDLAGRPLIVPTPMSYPGVRPQLAEQPVTIGPGVGTTGALPFANPFPLSLLQPRAAEQALVVEVSGRGLVLVTGCGHPGLEALVTRAREVYGAPVVGVVGGLHYEAQTAEQLAPHIAFLRALAPQLVALSPHDSGPAALAAFRDAFPEAYRDVRVGTPIVFGTTAEADEAH